MLTKSTHTYTTYGNVAVDFDVYEADDYPPHNPVFLFFHADGLTGGSRSCLPPWLAQACYEKKWPLMSASYRLLPQIGGRELLEDASAAYRTALNWKVSDSDSKRPVFVGGASAGFFMASLIAHHETPAPGALLSIEGIPTFRHSFFSSSTLLLDEPPSEEDFASLLDPTAPIVTDELAPHHQSSLFSLDRLLMNGKKNADYQAPKIHTKSGGTQSRGFLYDYLLYKNGYADLVGDVDPGFDWADKGEESSKLNAWPLTVFILAEKDTDVSTDVVQHVAKRLGSSKAKVCMAKGQAHLFESGSYLEDETPGMEAVHEALGFLNGTWT